MGKEARKEAWTRWKKQNQGYDNERGESEYDFEGDGENVGDWSEVGDDEAERVSEKDFEGDEENVGDWSEEEDALPDVEEREDDWEAVWLDDGEKKEKGKLESWIKEVMLRTMKEQMTTS